jgi:hypothetical protein
MSSSVNPLTFTNQRNSKHVLALILKSRMMVIDLEYVNTFVTRNLYRKITSTIVTNYALMVKNDNSNLITISV